MSDNFEDYDDDYDYGNTDGRGLRAQLKKALADKKAAEQERDQLRGKIAEATGVTILKDRVANPAAVARLATKEGVDLSDEKAIEQWLSDNEGAFVPATKSEQSTNPEGATPDGEEQPPVSAIPEGMESAFGAMSRIHAAASPTLVDAFARAQAAIPADATPAQVREAFKAAGL